MRDGRHFDAYYASFRSCRPYFSTLLIRGSRIIEGNLRISRWRFPDTTPSRLTSNTAPRREKFHHALFYRFYSADSFITRYNTRRLRAFAPRIYMPPRSSTMLYLMSNAKHGLYMPRRFPR